MKNILNVLKVNKIGEPPFEFCVERSCPTAFQGHEFEVIGNPSKRLKNANLYELGGLQ